MNFSGDQPSPLKAYRYMSPPPSAAPMNRTPTPPTDSDYATNVGRYVNAEIHLGLLRTGAGTPGFTGAPGPTLATSEIIEPFETVSNFK